jgi:isocitrate dehydrogenase (NAD+)
MVMPNLYGSIISSIGAGLVGGAGVSSGASVGNEFLLFD